jgi:hypothetical protein
MASSPAPKLLAALDTDATTMEEVARDLAIAIATALDGDGDGAMLVGPASAIMDDGTTLGLNLMLARPPGPLLAMQILPTFALDINTASERARFRDAIVEALKRYCFVRSFTTVRQLIEAARAPAPRREARHPPHSRTYRVRRAHLNDRAARPDLPSSGAPNPISAR